jgi:peroxiredoxin
MAVSSGPTPLGTPAPDFTLPDLDGTPVALADFANEPALLVAFVCNHCPYVRHVEQRLGSFHDAFEGTGLAMVAICSNDVAAYPDDDVPRLREQAERAGWRFPYLVDATQDVARAYGAVCTPDFFLFDADRRLAYRGAFDAATPGNAERVDGHLLRDAVSKVLAGRSVPLPHRSALGCGIKWREDA